MLKIIKTEFVKLKRFSIIWVGIAAMLACVLLTRFMATASDGVNHTLAQFANEVIWNNFGLIFPTTIALIAGYLIERERTDDTMKNISAIPISFKKLLLGKICALVAICVALSVIEFIFMVLTVLLSGYPIQSFMDLPKSLFQMAGMNLLVFVAVLPVILLTCQRSGGFVNGVIFAFFYGFVGIFAAGHNLENFYPVTAGLGLINYQGDEGLVYNKPINLLIIMLLVTLSILFIAGAKNRTDRKPKKDKK